LCSSCAELHLDGSHPLPSPQAFALPPGTSLRGGVTYLLRRHCPPIVAFAAASAFAGDALRRAFLPCRQGVGWEYTTAREDETSHEFRRRRPCGACRHSRLRRLSRAASAA